MATNVSVIASLSGKVNSSFKNTFNLAHKELGSLGAKTRQLDWFAGIATRAQTLRKELLKLHHQKKQVGDATGALARKIKKTTEQLKHAETAAKGAGLQLGKLGQAQKKYNSLAKLSRSKDRLVNQNQQIKQNLGNKRSQLVGTGIAAMAFAVPLKSAIMFENQMVQVAKKTGATGKTFEALATKAKALGGKTLFRATEVAQGMEKLAMAGFNNEKILSAIEPTLLLAAATNAELGTTADIASNIMTSFSIPATQMGHVADTLAKVTTSSNVSLEELGETMTYVGGTARQAGMSMAETSAIAGLLGNAGIKGSMAGTALRGMLSKLAAPSAAAGAMLKKLNVDVKDGSGNLLDLTDIIGSVAKATDHMGNADQIAVFKELVGMRPANALGQLIEQKGKGAIQAYMNEVKAAGGTAQAMAEAQRNTTQGQLTLLGSAVEGFFISMSKGLLPVISSISNLLAKFANKLEYLTTTFPNATKYIGLTIGALIGLKIASLASSFVMGGLTMGVNLYSIGTLKARIATLTFRTALLSLPITWIVAAIAGIGYLIYKNWETIKGWGKSVGQFFWNILKWWAKPYVWLWEKIKQLLSLAKKVKEAFTLGGILGDPNRSNVGHNKKVQMQLKEAGQFGYHNSRTNIVNNNQRVDVRVEGANPEDTVKAIKKQQHDESLMRVYNLQAAG